MSKADSKMRRRGDINLNRNSPHTQENHKERI